MVIEPTLDTDPTSPLLLIPGPLHQLGPGTIYLSYPPLVGPGHEATAVLGLFCL